MTNPNPTNPTLKCGHIGPDWNGEGDCITCARDRILGTKQDSDTNVVISKQELREYLKSKGWLWHESHVITNDCMDELEVHMQQMLSDTVNKVLDEVESNVTLMKTTSLPTNSMSVEAANEMGKMAYIPLSAIEKVRKSFKFTKNDIK